MTSSSPLAQTAETFEDRSRAHAVARRKMRLRLLELGDNELEDLYYNAITLAEHEAIRRANLYASRRQLIADLLKAVLASEHEYENLEDRAPTDPFCGDCNMGAGPHKALCAHHLRVAVIAKATGAKP